MINCLVTNRKSNIQKEDTVIEIGPGKGIITKQLAKKCSKVCAIEYDPYLYKTIKCFII